MKTLPLAEALKVCAETGYAHVEFALNPGYVTEPAAFSAEARRAAVASLREWKLSLPCLMTNMSLTADDKAHAQALELISAAAGLARIWCRIGHRSSKPCSAANRPPGNSKRPGWPTSCMPGRLRRKGANGDRHQGPRRQRGELPERLLWLLEQVNLRPFRWLMITAISSFRASAWRSP